MTDDLNGLNEMRARENRYHDAYREARIMSKEGILRRRASQQVKPACHGDIFSKSALPEADAGIVY